MSLVTYIYKNPHTNARARVDSYISYSDVQRYRSSLNQWDKYGCFKVIVVSFASNLIHRKKPELWEEFPRNNIGIKIMGKQA